MRVEEAVPNQRDLLPRFLRLWPLLDELLEKSKAVLKSLLAGESRLLHELIDDHELLLLQLGQLHTCDMSHRRHMCWPLLLLQLPLLLLPLPF